MEKYHMVTVYNFHLFEGNVERPRVAPYKATRAHVAQLRGAQVIEGTGEDVEAAAVDEHGRYRRVATGWGELA